jgi:hypothetical protein
LSIVIALSLQQLQSQQEQQSQQPSQPAQSQPPVERGLPLHGPGKGSRQQNWQVQHM